MGRGLGGAAESIRTLMLRGAVGAMSDGQLLERFLSGRDEEAFEALTSRHGPMVLGICRAVLRDAHAAEDAFQATWILLARRAGSVRQPDLLAAWLQRVARRVALRARTEAARRHARQRELADWNQVAASSAPCSVEGDAHGVILEELDRLPERYRVPVVLCLLQDLSYEEAARRLGCPIGTVRSRLSRARERLQDRLVRRGLAPAVALACLGAAGSAPADVSPALLASAVKAAMGGGAVPPTVGSLVVGVTRAMVWSRMAKVVGALAVVGAVVSLGAVAVRAAGASQKAARDAGKDGGTAKSDRAVPSLLKNGDFEAGDARRGTPTGWDRGAAIDGVRYLWDTKVAHGGKASLCLKKTSPRFFPIAQWSQEVSHEGPAKRLKIVAWIKADKVAKAVLDVQFQDAAGEGTHKWVTYIGAKEANDPPVTHDWKRYEGVVEIPDGTKQIAVAPQIYGPGTVWFDDLSASYTEEPATEPGDGAAQAAPARVAPDADVADVPAVEHTAGGDANKRYILVGPVKGSAPGPEGHRLLVILPGGDGGADFNPFVRRIAKNALPSGYIVAQPLAFEWSPGQAESIVWPVAGDRVAGQKFSTEEFVASVVADVRRTHKVDPRYIFALGWSSGGPPSFAAGMRGETGVTGAFVAMSVFQPRRLPNLASARGRAFYLLHSPQDTIPIAMAESARDVLGRNGAKVQLATYEGGHGWHGDVFGEIRRGLDWLEANHGEPGKGATDR